MRCFCHPQIEDADPDCPAHGPGIDPRRFREGWDAAVRGEPRHDWQTDEWKSGYDDLVSERQKDLPDEGLIWRVMVQGVDGPVRARATGDYTDEHAARQMLAVTLDDYDAWLVHVPADRGTSE